MAYMNADKAFPDGLEEQVAEALARLEEHAGKTLGDAEDPLLVSVRSRGAGVDAGDDGHRPEPRAQRRVGRRGWRRKTGNERFAWDSYRRFVQMYGNVVMGIEGERFEDAIKAIKKDRGSRRTPSSTSTRCRRATVTFKGVLRLPGRSAGRSWPARSGRCSTPGWATARSSYRRINRIPDDWGTAVNVQQMVFGNKGDTSGSGVAFSRDEVTGEPEPSGDFLANAQGEDVVSGVRTPRDIRELREWQPEVHAQLMDILRTLEQHYGDMQDTEFTVEEGRLYMLQTRNAKRPAQAAVRFAVDAVGEGLLDKAGALVDDRRREARRAAAPDVRPRRRLRRCWPGACPPRRARPRARSSSSPTRRWRRRRRAATWCWCGRSPRPTTSRASMPPRAC